VNALVLATTGHNDSRDRPPNGVLRIARSAPGKVAPRRASEVDVIVEQVEAVEIRIKASDRLYSRDTRAAWVSWTLAHAWAIAERNRNERMFDVHYAMRHG